MGKKNFSIVITSVIVAFLLVSSAVTAQALSVNFDVIQSHTEGPPYPTSPLIVEASANNFFLHSMEYSLQRVTPEAPIFGTFIGSHEVGHSFLPFPDEYIDTGFDTMLVLNPAVIGASLTINNPRIRHSDSFFLLFEVEQPDVGRSVYSIHWDTDVQPLNFQNVVVEPTGLNKLIVSFDLISTGIAEVDPTLPLYSVTISAEFTPADGVLPEANYPGDFDTFQAAVNALTDGGTLRIAEGEYDVPQPIFIRNKNVNIVGGGANCKDLLPDTEQFSNKSREIKSLGTVLIGPEVEGRVPPEESIGNINFSNGGGSVKGIWSRNGKAGIVGRVSNGEGKPLEVSDVCITDAYRGIHWKAAAPLTVTDTIIANIEWNGISIATETILYVVEHTVFDTSFVNPDGACIYFENTFGGVMNDNFYGCKNGGVVSQNSIIGIGDSIFINNYKAAVILGSSTGQLRDNRIFITKPTIFTNVYGDGVMAVDNSTVVLQDNHIVKSARAAVSNFGSVVELESNHLICQAIDLAGNPLNGTDFVFIDNGDNLCGCDFPLGPCKAESASLEPPKPVGGAE